MTERSRLPEVRGGASPSAADVASETGGDRRGVGTVYLVGAGPGDPRLLTVAAARLLRRADVVVHDALVSPEILRRIRPDARIVDVGKRCGGRRTSQEEINAMLVDAARDARVVVRLKGGDPFVFGRGGEEALALRAAGVAFRVVPGVTAGIGVAAYAGIPVTHRSLSSSVTFVTGHEDSKRGDSRVDWDSFARLDGTLVVYMGVTRLERIAERLIQGGRSPAMPAAVIEWGTRARQRTVTAPLSEIAAATERAGIGSPALLVVGEVAAMRERIGWFDQLPLRGRRIVVARSRPQRSRIALSLRRLGAEVIELPRLRSEPLPADSASDAMLMNAGGYGWIIFSSAPGVRTFWRRLRHLGLDARALAGARIAALGRETARALRRVGIQPDLDTRTFDVDAVADALTRSGSLSGVRVLFPREANFGSAIVSDLRDRGTTVDELGLFRTVAVPGGVEESPELVVLPSSTAARLYAEAFPAVADPAPRVIAIGPATAQTALSYGVPVDAIPDRHDLEGVVGSVLALVAQLAEDSAIRAPDPGADADRLSGGPSPAAAAAAHPAVDTTPD